MSEPLADFVWLREKNLNRKKFLYDFYEQLKNEWSSHNRSVLWRTDTAVFFIFRGQLLLCHIFHERPCFVLLSGWIPLTFQPLSAPITVYITTETAMWVSVYGCMRVSQGTQLIFESQFKLNFLKCALQVHRTLHWCTSIIKHASGFLAKQMLNCLQFAFAMQNQCHTFMWLLKELDEWMVWLVKDLLHKLLIYINCYTTNKCHRMLLLSEV